MKTTYNEILNSMKTTFFNEYGENVHPLSDLEARFEAVASELFSISCYGDYIMRQAFAQTATGEYLDFHAGLRGIERKSASKAVGRLTFSIAEPVDTDIVIPQGTICAVKGSPYIQYSTDASATISSGETTATVCATAISTGEEYNAQPGEITVMVNPPIGVTAVRNNYSFIGGSDCENDEKLRKRILSSYSVPQGGLSIEMLRSAVLDNDEIIDCNIVNHNTYVDVYVMNREAEMTSEAYNAVTGSLGILELFGIGINVLPASEESFDLSIELKSNDDVRAQVISAVNEFASGLRIGEAVTLYKLISTVAAIDGVEYCNISSNKAEGGIIACNSSKVLRLHSAEVTNIE